MLKIAGVQVFAPADVRVKSFDLEKSLRAASGRLVVEVIATKRQVDVVWRYIPDAELQSILSLLATNKPFFTFEYPDAGGQQTMIAHVSGDISRSLWYTIAGVKRWEEVTISFVEQ